MATRRFFRLVLSNPPTPVDFVSAREQGKLLRFEAYRREWSDALSVYDKSEIAAIRSRAFRYRLGRYVAVLVVPEPSDIEVRQTMTDPHHFSLYATGSRAEALVSEVLFIEEDHDRHD